MENIMTNGFCELNEQEMMETEGGLIGLAIAVGVAAAIPLAIDIGCAIVGTINYAQAAVTNYRCKF